MAVRTRSIDFADGDTALRGTLAWDDARAGRRPGILVAHAWRGRSGFEDDKARMLAELGYAGFALDLYGKGVLGESATQNAKLMQPFLDDRAMLARRLHVALDTLRAEQVVDPAQIGAIGFCFGGLCVLDLARSGADVAGVVSFHGLLGAPPEPQDGPIGARILVLHGWDDPMATPDAVVALGRELGARGADWQLHAYGNTLHAFTNPAADDIASGLRYDPLAERRALRSMRDFFSDIFSKNNN
mgnify:CR=1 FL=1